MIYRQALRNPKSGRENNHVIILAYYNPAKKVHFMCLHITKHVVNWETRVRAGLCWETWTHHRRILVHYVIFPQLVHTDKPILSLKEAVRSVLLYKQADKRSF